MKARMFLSIAFAAMALACVSSCKDDDRVLGSSVNEPFDSNGAGYALFSVGDGRQVRFSRGNLQYRASTGTFRFAERQQDYIGEGNADISPTNDGWIDLFGWGTSGWNSGAVCCQPWDTVKTDSDYCPGASWTNDLTGDYADADWAWYNAISNGGNSLHRWRTLSEDEWLYLIEGRENAASLCGAATVDGTYGFVILPDNWVDHGMLPAFRGLPSDFWTDNVYTSEQWNLMESSGAIFLPAAGNRTGTIPRGIAGEHVYGIYWSSTHDDSNADNACCMSFSSTRIEMSISSRGIGCAVRPVQDCTEK